MRSIEAFAPPIALRACTLFATPHDCQNDVALIRDNPPTHVTCASKDGTHAGLHRSNMFSATEYVDDEAASATKPCSQFSEKAAARQRRRRCHAFGG